MSWRQRTAGGARRDLGEPGGAGQHRLHGTAATHSPAARDPCERGPGVTGSGVGGVQGAGKRGRGIPLDAVRTLRTESAQCCLGIPPEGEGPRYLHCSEKEGGGGTHMAGRLGKKAKENKLFWPLNIHDSSLAKF